MVKGYRIRIRFRNDLKSTNSTASRIPCMYLGCKCLLEQLYLQSLAVTSHTVKNPWPGLRSICPGGDNFQFPGDDCLHFKLCKQKNYPHSRPGALVTIFSHHNVMMNKRTVNECIVKYSPFFLLSTVFMLNALIYFFESAGQDGRYEGSVVLCCF